MGVWIETLFPALVKNNLWSHPVWVCGLKQFEENNCKATFCHTLYGCVD